MTALSFDPRSIPPERRLHLIARDSRPALVNSGLDGVVAELDNRIAVSEPTMPAVIVAGETKRGKSSLINALVGRPMLSPVGPDVVTSCFISFVSGQTDAAVIIRSDQPSRVEVPLSSLADWVTVDGNPGNEKEVRGAYVQVDAPAIAGLALVDTPGVGGLDTGHAALTMQALSRADAMVFVVDAGSPITNPEIDFLLKATERIDTVVMVLTKVDIYPGWETVAQDNRELLGRRASQFRSYPWVPVSSRLGEYASGLDPASAATMRAESGIATLEDLLKARVVRRAHLLGLANAARFLRGALQDAAEATTQRVVASAGPPEVLAALESEQKHLADLARPGASWRRELDDSIKLIGLERSEELRIGLTELRHVYTQRIDAVKRTELENVPDELLADVAALADQLARSTAEQILDRVAEILGEIDESSPLVRVISELGDTGTGEFGRVPLPGQKSMSLGDHLTAVGALSTGRSIETIIGGAVGGFAFLGPIGGIGVGLAFWALRTWGITGTTKRADIRGWLGQQLTDAQAQISNLFARGTIRLQGQLGQAISDHLASRQQRITSTLEARSRMLAESVSDRREELGKAQQALGAIAQLQARADRLLFDLAAIESAEQGFVGGG